jgi:RNA polymerase sigma factor (sigma-70 family)
MADSIEEHAVARMASDPDAVVLIYRAHAERLAVYLRRRTGDTELTAELVAEVFAAAIESSSRYVPETSVRGWLFGIANHKLTDSYRRKAIDDRARRRLGVPPLHAEDPEIADLDARLDAHEQGGRLLALVGDLPEAERSAVTALVLEDEDLRDFAARMRISDSAARQRLSRGLRRLAITVRKAP